jgi:hypothetical protein
MWSPQCSPCILTGSSDWSGLVIPPLLFLFTLEPLSVRVAAHYNHLIKREGKHRRKDADKQGIL